MHIRQATELDAQSLAQLMVQMDAPENCQQIEEATAEQVTAVKQTLNDMKRHSDFKTYLVYEDGKTTEALPVASFSLMIFSSPSHQGARQALLDAVVVRTERRGQGIGEAMLTDALTKAAAAGCYKLMLSSNLKRIDAHRFYERAGFTQHGISFAIDLPI